VEECSTRLDVLRTLSQPSSAATDHAMLMYDVLRTSL
jgi:hypothetical protein